MLKIDTVFSGGGVKAFAFIGALQSLSEKKYTIERVAGTSAGAIIASLIAAKYTVEEIEDLLTEIELKKFLDLPMVSKTIPFSKWILLYFKMGLYKGDQFEKWLHRVLLLKGIKTFADIQPGYLKIVVSDVTLGKLIILPDDLYDTYGLEEHELNISTAVRMSASYPYFFIPKKLKNRQLETRYIVDGGLLSNFPLWVFNNRQSLHTRPVIGFTLSDSFEHLCPNKINNALEMLHAFFLYMIQAQYERYIYNNRKCND